MAVEPGAVDQVVEAILSRLLGRHTPLLVALDGRSGSGKSTLARTIGREIGAAVIEGDDFYGGGSSAFWDAKGPAEQVAHCIDWRRQRPVLGALANGRAGTWHPFDWESDVWDADPSPLAGQLYTCEPLPVVILEGAYSARPELADLVELRVLLDTDRAVARARLLEREGEEYRADWEARWSRAEEHYFTTVMPQEAFDLIVRT